MINYILTTFFDKKKVERKENKILTFVKKLAKNSILKHCMKKIVEEEK